MVDLTKLKAITPPIVLSGLRKHFSNFSGDYMSWHDAQMHSSGYDDAEILERVRNAAWKVKQGEAVFDRDAVCFYHEEYRWATLASLLRIAAENGGVLRVLDFGGALGSFYFQHRKHFKHLRQVRWAVVEQAHFIQCGQDAFQDDVLQFHENIQGCLEKGDIDVIFCSSVLEYIEDPYGMLNEFSKSNIQYILLDRTPFIEAAQDRLTVQRVPDAIYPASYPAWFFSSSRFEHELRKMGLQKIVEFAGEDDVGIGKFKGVLLAHT